MTPPEATAPFDLRRLLVDAGPAVFVALAVSAVMTRRVDELDGKLGVLAVAGVLGIGLSALLLRQPITNAASPGAPALELVTLPAPLPSPAGPVIQVSPVQGSSIDGFESFSLQKEGAAEDENEDSVSINATTGTIAISDGASSSFGARVWSRALVDVAADKPAQLTAQLVEAVMGPAAEQWTQHHSGGELPWWAQEGLRRGGFATLLLVRVGTGREGRAWQALAVGDSCVFHLRRSTDGWQLLRAFPLETAEAFGSHPVLLSSVSPPPTAGIELAGGQLAAGDVLLAATDAVSEWLLGDPDRLAFAVEAPIDEVAQAVREARQNQSMVNDDATFVRFMELR